jgi:hypothetical protein
MPQISPIKFSKELQKELFPANEFYKKSRVESGIGPDVENVEIPVSGDISAALSGDPESLPLQVETRTDTKKSYPVEQLYTKPVVIRREEDIVLNYNKRQDVIDAQAMSLNTRAARVAAVNWGANLATNIIRTSGSTTRACEITGTTGTRKVIAKADMLSVLTTFRRMNLPNLGVGSVWGLITPEMAEDLLNIQEFVDADKTGEQRSRLLTGEFAFIAGMNLMIRSDNNGSTGVKYNNDATPLKSAIDTAVAATDNAAGIFWHPKMVRHAEGNAAALIDRNKPEWLGATLVSSVVRFGATFDRPDEKGIVALVQAAGA